MIWTVHSEKDTDNSHGGNINCYDDDPLRNTHLADRNSHFPRRSWGISLGSITNSSA